MSTNVDVVVKGDPFLTLNNKGKAFFNAAESTATELVFDYEVGPNQDIADLKFTGGALPANTSIKSVTGAALDLKILSTADFDIVIDTIAPKVSNFASLDGAGKALNPAVGLVQGDHVTFSLTFSEAVDGTPGLLLNDGATAAFVGSSKDAKTLTFTYDVGAEGSTDLHIIGFDGALTDMAGNGPGAIDLDTNLKVNTFSWKAAQDGSWHDPSKWTENQVPGGQSAAFITATGKAYTVTMYGPPVFYPALGHAAPTTEIGSLSVGAGATLDLPTSITSVTQQFFVDFDLSNAGRIHIAGGNGFFIGMGDASASIIANKGVIDFDSAYWIFGNDVTLTGGGTINLRDLHGSPVITNHTLVSAATQDVSLINVDNKIIGSASSLGPKAGSGHTFTLINQAKGLINASSNQPLMITASEVENAGTLMATNSGGLWLQADTTNSGLIEALSAGKVTNSFVVIEDITVTNTSKGVILASGVGARVDIADSAIVGGTLKSMVGSGLTAAAINVSGISTFDGSEPGNPLNNAAMVNVNSSLVLEGTINNTATISVQGSGNLRAIDDVTLTGTGKVLLGNNFTLEVANAANEDATLTNVSNTIIGSGMVGDDPAGGMFTLINQAKGVIDAADATFALTLSPDAVQNAGVIEGKSAKGVFFDDTDVANSNLIEALTAAKGTTALVKIDDSTITNTNKGVILASGIGAHVDIIDSTIVGGTLKTMGGSGPTTAAINVSGISTFDGSQPGNPLNIAGMVNLSGHLWLEGAVNNTGTVSLQKNTNIHLTDDTTFSGTGKVMLGAVTALVNATGEDVTLTNVSNTFVGGHISNNSTTGTVALVNQAKGVLEGHMYLAPETLQNAGIIKATNGTLLAFQDTNVVNSNLIQALNTATTGFAGVVIGESTITNTNKGVILASGANAQISMGDGTVIVGGTLKSMGGSGATAALFEVFPSKSAVFDGSQPLNPLNLMAQVVVEDNGELELRGTINNTGKIVLDFGSELTISGANPVTLNGKGSIGLTNAMIGADADTSLTNNGNTISGTGAIGDSDTAIINNKGTMAASGGELDLAAKSVSNGGILAALTGGTLHIETDIMNTAAGLVQTMAVNTHITLDDASITGGKVSIFKGSFLDVVDGMNIIAALVTNAGEISVDGGDLTITGAVTNTGLFDVNGHHLTFQGVVTGGTATINPLTTGLTNAKIADHPSGEFSNFVFDINNDGDYVGSYRTKFDAYEGGNPPNHGFLMQDGKFIELAHPDSKSTLKSGDIFPTVPFGINDAGQVVGQWFTVEASANGTFLWDGSFDELDPDHFVTDINNNGVMVGNANGVGYITTDGKTFKTISNPLGVNGTHIDSVNDAGVVVGSYFDENFYSHGFYYDGSKYHTIDDPNAVFTDPGSGVFITGINNHDQIVGYYFDAPGFSSYKSFVYQDGQFITLNDPGMAGKTAVAGINDVGQIVGTFKDDKGQQHSFLAELEQDGGVLEFDAAASTNVFIGFGTLILDNATNTANKFTGKISGFGEGDNIVLGAIDFAGSTKVTQNFANNKGGTVTVTDAANHSITLSFVGDYRNETFVIQDDLSGNVDLMLA